MSVILPTVPPYYTAPRLNYKVAQTLQLAFDSGLGWLNNSYHIAKVGINAEQGKNYPQIYANDGTTKHYDVRPDNNIGAYSFIEENRPYVVDYENDLVTYYFSVIFWCNLDIIDNSKNYDYTSELIKDVTNVLDFYEAADLEIETRPERIFDKYNGVTQELKQFLMRKYSAFKITFSIQDSFSDDCPADPVDTCQQNADRVNNLPTSIKNCVLESVCPEPLNADVNVNSVFYDTVASGGEIDIPIKDTADNTVSANVIANTKVEIPDISVNINSTSFNTYLATVSPNIIVKNTDGDQVGSKVGNEWIVPKGGAEIFFKGIFATNVDTLPQITIDADNAGTYTIETTDGASGSFTYSINGGAFAAFVNPTVLSVGDTFVARRSIFTASGFFKWEGTGV